MPVKRTKISRRQSLPTISEAHGAISSFPMPEIKGAPTEVAPFIERDDFTEHRERRMGRLTKEEREAKRKARKEKKRAEKRRAKELGSSKDESSTMPTVSEEQDPASGAFPSTRDPVSVSIVSPCKSPFKSPRVSLEDAIRKRNQMTTMDFSNLSSPSISGDGEVDTLGNQEDTPASCSGAVVSEANCAAVNPPKSPITILKGDLTGSETFDRNASSIAVAGVASNTSISLIYDHSDHKLGGDGSDTSSKRFEVASIAKENLIKEKESQIIGTNSQKTFLPFSYSGKTSEPVLDSPRLPDGDVTGSPQPEQDNDDEDSARIAAEVDRLLMSATKELLQPRMPSNITNGALPPDIIVASSLTAIENVHNPSHSDAVSSFATKGPYSGEESCTGLMDDMTVEVSQSSSENEFDELNLATNQVVDPNKNSSVHDDSEDSETSATIARNMRLITIRRASMCGPKPDYPDSSDDEDLVTPGATPIIPFPSIDAKQDRPVRRESKANLRKLRQGPQMFTTSAFGIVSLSGDDEEIVADDDIIVHAFPVGDDLVLGNANGVQVHHAVEAREDCTGYDTRSNARQFQSNEESELVMEEQKESKRSWIILIVLLLASGLSAAIHFGVTKGANGSSSGLQSPYSDDTTSTIASQPPSGVLKYDPPTAEECGIIENGGTLEGDDELLRRDFDLLIDVELMNGFSLDGPTTLLPDLQARMNKYLIPHLAGCDNGPRSRLLRGQSSASRRLANVRYVIANADAIVKLDESRTCETSATISNCYAVKVSLNLKLKGEEKNFPITKVVHQSLDENNSLRRTLQLSAPFGEAFVTDIISTDSATATTVQTIAPTESPSSAPSIDLPTGSPSA
ncbi:MAG: hypothetical protein SGBAC_010458 [Bacillariaceae sp.]